MQKVFFFTKKLYFKFKVHVSSLRPPPTKFPSQTTFCVCSRLLHVILSCWGNTALICILITELISWNFMRWGCAGCRSLSCTVKIHWWLHRWRRNNVWGDKHTVVYDFASESTKYCLTTKVPEFPNQFCVHLQCNVLFLASWEHFSYINKSFFYAVFICIQCNSSHFMIHVINKFSLK